MSSAVPGSMFLVPGSCSEFQFGVQGSRFGVRANLELRPGTLNRNLEHERGTWNRNLELQRVSMKQSLRSWLWRVDVKQEVDEEIAFHMEMRSANWSIEVVDPRVAREMVLARLGDVGRLKRTCVDLGRKREREMRVTQFIEEFRADVTSAFRQMKASPGFTLVAAITLALGIGANSAIFALADATFLRPLPFTAPHDRLVMLWERYPNGVLSQVTPLDFRRLGRSEPSFDAMAAFLSNSVAMIGPDGTAEQVSSQMVGLRFFDVLGVTPIAGRTFVASDAVEPNSVVLSEGFWRRRFGADPSLVGRSITIAGRPQTVIGIVPDRFRVVPATISNAGSEPPSLWTVFNYHTGGDPSQRASSLHVCRRSHQGRCGLRRGAARHDRDRQTQRGALPADQHRSRPERCSRCARHSWVQRCG